MLKRVLLFASLAACSTPSQGVGDPCSASKLCAEGLACSTGTCRTLCNSSGECDGLSCVRGVCVACEGAGCEPLGTLGTSCGEGSECLSGHCVDGVCCETSCGETCFACGLSGQCEAEPGCALRAPLGSTCTLGAECQSSFCVDGRCCENLCGGVCAACNGAGRCMAPPDDSECGPIDCDALDTSCRDYADLQTNRCVALGACHAANGDACATFVNAQDGNSCGASSNVCLLDSVCEGGVCVTESAGNTTSCEDGRRCTTPDLCDGAGGCNSVEHCSLVVDRGLVARYFLDEGSTPVPTPSTLVDRAAAPPHDLTASYASGAMTTTQTMGDEGLAWAVEGADGGACQGMQDTKIETRLHGRTEATIEVKVDLEAGIDTNFGSRIVHFGLGANQTDLALVYRCGTPCRVELVVNRAVIAGWEPTPALADRGKTVLTAVLDSTQAAASERAKLYVDGVLLTPASDEGVAITRDQTLDLATATDMCVGNLWSSAPLDHSPGGALYYVALYDKALSPNDVAANATALQTDDDFTP